MLQMKYLSWIHLAICFCMAAPVLGASNAIMLGETNEESSSVIPQSLLRRRYLEQEEEEFAQVDNRLAFAETPSGQLVFIVAGSLAGLAILYYFLHDYLKACLCCCCQEVDFDDNDDDDYCSKDNPKKVSKMEQTTRTGLGTVDEDEEDVSNLDGNKSVDGDSALVK